MTIPGYDELEIRLAGAAGAYRVDIRSANGAEASGRFVRPFSDEGLELLRMSLDPTRGPGRSARVRDPDRATDFGDTLFDALLADDDVRDVYKLAKHDAGEAERGIRVTLNLSEAPGLAGIPWELLYDRPTFLAQSIWTPVVRYLALPSSRRPLKVSLPLRILGMVSSPDDDRYPKLDAAAERARVEGALKPLIDAGAVHVRWLERGTLRAIQREVARGEEFHVFHFIGHGDHHEGQGVVVLELENRRPDLVDGERLGRILCDRRKLRLAVLNACDLATTRPEDPFAGVAASLLQWEVPAVIGMQFPITDQAAITFAEEFYATLADGYPVDAAITEARRALAASDEPLEWSTPVLFMRVVDGRLFDIVERPNRDTVRPVPAAVPADGNGRGEVQPPPADEAPADEGRVDWPTPDVASPHAVTADEGPTDHRLADEALPAHRPANEAPTDHRPADEAPTKHRPADEARPDDGLPARDDSARRGLLGALVAVAIASGPAILLAKGVLPSLTFSPSRRYNDLASADAWKRVEWFAVFRALFWGAVGIAATAGAALAMRNAVSARRLAGGLTLGAASGLIAGALEQLVIDALVKGNVLDTRAHNVLLGHAIGLGLVGALVGLSGCIGPRGRLSAIAVAVAAAAAGTIAAQLFMGSDVLALFMRNLLPAVFAVPAAWSPELARRRVGR